MAQFHRIVMSTATNARPPVLPPHQRHAHVRPATRIRSSTSAQSRQVVLARRAGMIIVLVEPDIELMGWHRMIRNSLGWRFQDRSIGSLLRLA
jgi:hypothetical protein